MRCSDLCGVKSVVFKIRVSSSTPCTIDGPPPPSPLSPSSHSEYKENIQKLNIMFARRHYIMTSHICNGNQITINGLVFAILLLTSSVEIIADDVGLMEGGSNQEVNCTLYRSCTQCADASICSWLMEKQICVYSNQSVSEKFVVDTKESCPAFAVTYDNYLLQVTVSNIAVKSVNSFFRESPNIGCEIENKTYNASINNGVITCKWLEKNSIPSEDRSTIETNSLFILYFSIVVNNVRLQFNDPRDHYISYHGWTCPNENCTVSFWESDSRKYYCKWCLKTDSCKTTAEQLNSCDIRNAINNEKWKDDALLYTIEVKSPDVAIESFKPDVLPFHRITSTVVSITVKNHRILAEGRLKTVSLAGQNCDNPVTVDDHTINCTARYPKVASEGSVVIEYEWINNRVVRLKSAQKFKFVEPKVTGISPSCVPATGGTRIELTGEYLNATADVRVYFRKTKSNTMCEIVALAQDRIGCVTSANTGIIKSGPVQIVFENTIGKFYNKNMFRYVADPTVLEGQVFEGIASGDVPLTVRGGFDCTENQQMYFDYNGTKYYGHCALRTNDTSTMDCWPPKLDDPGQMLSLSFRFHVELAGKVVILPQQTSYSYLLHPDPVYTDFEVYDGTVVRVEGVFPALLQRRRLDGNYILEVTFRSDEMDDDERFTMINVTDNYIECRSPFDTSVADILEIAITVGKRDKRTVVQRRHRQYYVIVRSLQPQYVIGGISSLLICAFALMFCVKKIMSNSKQHMDRRYLGELRNITAGIDDTADYLLNSNTGKKSKTRR